MLRKWTGPAILAWAGRCTIKCTIMSKKDGRNIVSRRLKVSAISAYRLSISLIRMIGAESFLKKLHIRITAALTISGNIFLTAIGSKCCRIMWLS
jgi:small neutral amino acid transporter SnatA (MarC family)